MRQKTILRRRFALLALIKIIQIVGVISLIITLALVRSGEGQEIWVSYSIKCEEFSVKGGRRKGPEFHLHRYRQGSKPCEEQKFVK